jgi:hypothetical protein
MEKYNSLEKKEAPEKSLEEFRQEIQRLKDEEIEKKGQKANPDLLGTEVEELTEDDMRIWQNYKKLTVENITEKDMQEFENYRRSINAKETPGRENFCAFLANKLAGLWGEKELRDMKKRPF